MDTLPLSDAVLTVADWMRAHSIALPSDLAANIELVRAMKQVRFIPDGASEPPVPVPSEVEISEGDIEQALIVWDDLMPEFAGLLDAVVTRKQGGEDA